MRCIHGDEIKPSLKGEIFLLNTSISALWSCGTLAHSAPNESASRGERILLVFWSLLFVSLNCDNPDFTKRLEKKKNPLK